MAHQRFGRGQRFTFAACLGVCDGGGVPRDKLKFFCTQIASTSPWPTPSSSSKRGPCLIASSTHALTSLASRRLERRT